MATSPDLNELQTKVERLSVEVAQLEHEASQMRTLKRSEVVVLQRLLVTDHALAQARAQLEAHPDYTPATTVLDSPAAHLRQGE